MVTGGTGSIGRAIVESLVPRDDVDAIRVVSRSESKQAEMRDELNCDKIRYVLGDVRDKEKMKRAFVGAHTVIHAAALKRVEVCEYNADECCGINIDGSDTVAGAAMAQEVERVLLIGTDKAVDPHSLMGMSKAFAERMYLAFNSWSKCTKFWAVRLGNVLHSTGSVLPTWERQAKTGKIQVTDPLMTRFLMSKCEVANFVSKVLEFKEPGLYAPNNCRKVMVGDLAEVFCELQECEMEVIGVRPGEKKHEAFFTDEEGRALGWSEAAYKSEFGPSMNKDEIREMLIEVAE